MNKLFRRLRTYCLALGVLLVAQGANADVCPLHNANPALHGNLLVNPKIYLVFWGLSAANDPDGEIQTLTKFAQNVGGTKYLNTITQYTSNDGADRFSNLPGMLGGTWTDPVAPPTTRPNGSAFPTHAEFAQEIARAVSNAAWNPAPDQDALFVVAVPSSNWFPTNPEWCDLKDANGNPLPPNSKGCFCASHDSNAVTGFGNWVPYVPLAYQSACWSATGTSAQKTTGVLSHELAEAIINPRQQQGTSWTGWRDDNGGNCGGEVADYCGGTVGVTPVDITTDDSIYSFTSLWSNATNGCVFTYQTRLDRFWLDSYGALEHSYSDRGNNGMDSWGTPPATLRSYIRPAAASTGYNSIDVFAPDTNGHMRHAYGSYPFLSWDDWGVLPSPYTQTGAPSAASWGPNRMDVFTLGVNGSAVHVFHRYWDAVNGSHPWQDWGGPTGVTLLPSGIGATAMGPGTIDFFVTNGTDIYHGRCTGACTSGTWGGNWGHESGTTIVGAPEASSWGPSRIDVFYSTNNGTVAHRSYDAGAYSSWGDFGKQSSYTFSGSPGAVGFGEQSMVFGVNTTAKTLGEYTYTPSGGAWTAGLAVDVAGPPDFTSW